jgi:hypothetical protein
MWKQFKLLDNYNNQHITSSALFEICAIVYKNVNAIKYAITTNDARATEIETE